MLVLLLFSSLPAAVVASHNPPEQVHLSYNGRNTEMVVTWHTMDKFGKVTTVPYVLFGDSSNVLGARSFASTSRWTDGGTNRVTRFTYRATMKDLSPGRRYYYRVGSDEGLTDVFSFVAMRNDGKLRAAVYGDFSVEGGQSMPVLLNATNADSLDIIFHIGDIAYDLDTNDGKLGDEFMRWIEPVAARVPYMVLPGNHDQNQDFLHYENRFTMPPNGIYDDNQFWSFDIGNVHFIGISSEYYGFNMYEEANKQFEWLQNDLQQNKAKPWTIYFIHRPMYCSNKKKHHCQKEEFIMTRNGVPGLPGLEIPLNRGGVDLGFWAHRHTYERFFPLLQNATFTQPDPQHFHNSPTPAYILSGAAGCHDHIDTEKLIPAPYSAARLPNYGFVYLEIESDTALSTRLVTVDDPSKPLDVFRLTKDPGYKPGQKKIE